jgi:predicted Zn-dependent protease
MAAPQAGGADESALLNILTEELEYATQQLVLPDGTKPYFLAYTVMDQKRASISAELGAITGQDDSHNRVLDVDVRVGGYDVDNSHRIRGGRGGFDPADFMSRGTTAISLEDDPVAIKQAVWLATDRKFKSAVRKYQRVLTNLKTMVEEEDKSDDFSRESPSYFLEPQVDLDLDRDAWARRLREVSEIAWDHPLIYRSQVSLSVNVNNRYMVSSEGTRLQTGQKLLRVAVSANTKAEDGMELNQSFIFNASSEQGLPGQEEIAEAFRKVITQVLDLREAPLVEPYIGPAILMNRASGVFFHEIFGHRIEGHRQKDVEEGQTFTKKIGEPVLPTFISVHDNPTLAKFGENSLRGYYQFDDEGVSAQDVTLVDNGVLKTFLLSRSPVEGFPKSNGHGRRSPGRDVVSRQGNLMMTSTNQVGFEELRNRLIEECRRQEKPYGMLFEDITGGFTGTRRRGPQSFKVLPVVVYKVYADGRPDELVRGVDIVGTPLTCFSKITCTGDDPDVFNGTCGAESGWVPVSAVSPSILVSEIEIEKRRRQQDKPPILLPPVAEPRS